MTTLLSAVVLFLIINLALGLVRVGLGPTPEDRMLAALLFGSTTVAVLVLLAEIMAIAALRDVALLLVMLAAIISVAFVGLSDAGEEDDA